MRRYLSAAIVMTAFLSLAWSASAQDLSQRRLPPPSQPTTRGLNHGFGGLSLNNLGTLHTASNSIAFGGRAAINLSPNVQAFGEVGRIGNLLPSTSELLLSFTPIDATVPAFYGEAGFRGIASPRSAVSPYVEGSAGFARLDFRIDGASALVDTASELALNVVGRTSPIASFGGGVMLHGGRLSMDLG